MHAVWRIGTDITLINLHFLCWYYIGQLCRWWLSWWCWYGLLWDSYPEFITDIPFCSLPELQQVSSIVALIKPAYKGHLAILSSLAIFLSITFHEHIYLCPSRILKIITFCCVQDGVVREHGTHSELLSMKGHYFRLVQAQRHYENNVGWVEIQIYSCHWCCSPTQSKTSHNSGL